MAIVLTSNEVVINPEHAWKDIEGVQYHYPNQYKNLIKSGERFIYYRGVRRKGGRRARAEYFGAGTIGEITSDPQTVRQARPSWFCSIEDYKPFPTPISAKVDGAFFEHIASNMWRNGVRPLPDRVFDQIISLSGIQSPGVAKAKLPATIAESETLLLPKTKVIGSGSGSGGGWRRSKQSREIGDWAEEAAMKFVREKLGAKTITHRAGLGEKPGWDFDYTDDEGVLHRVEVKGTVAAAFTSIDLTVGEYKASMTHQKDYWLYLIANCLTDHPKVQRIRNPSAKLANKEWIASPILFNISFRKS